MAINHWSNHTELTTWNTLAMLSWPVDIKAMVKLPLYDNIGQLISLILSQNLDSNGQLSPYAACLGP